MPEFNSAAKVTLLEGSGVKNGKMTANFRCSNCDSWDGGKMDFSSSSGSFIWGSYSGSAISSDDTSASISRHNKEGKFKVDLSNAQGGSSSNPFVDGTQTTGGGGGGGGSGTTPRCRPRPNGSTGNPPSSPPSHTPTSSRPQGFDGDNHPTGLPWNGGPGPADTPPGWRYGDHDKRDDTDGDDSELPYCEPDQSPTGSAEQTQSGLSGFLGLSSNQQRNILIAHGVLGCLAFAVVFPLGGIMIRLLSFSGLAWAHAAVQVTASLIYGVCFGLGVYMANGTDKLDEYHPVIGIVLLILVFFQPIFGWIHHINFKKFHARTIWSYFHLWLGRCIITLGIINGGLGFLFADNTTIGYVVYAIVAAIIWLVYVSSAVFGEIRRLRIVRDDSKTMDGLISGTATPPREYYAMKTPRGPE